MYEISRFNGNWYKTKYMFDIECKKSSFNYNKKA